MRRFKSGLSAVLRIFLSAEGCGCVAESGGKVYVLIAVNTVPSRSSRYICGLLRFSAVGISIIIIIIIAIIFSVV